MVRGRVLVVFLLSAVLLPVRPAKAQDEAAFDGIKPELRDPVWTALNNAFFDTFQKRCSNTIMGVLFGVAAYDALSVYSDKYDGLVVGGAMRRPAKERTIENKRTAIAIATYRVLAAVYGSRATDTFSVTLSNLNISTNDTTLDPSTPFGIGNLVALAVLKSDFNDHNEMVKPPSDKGLAQARSMADMPEYVPKNTPYKLKFRSRWQPLEVLINDEYPAVQMYSLHKMGRRPLLSGYHPSFFDVPKPKASLAPWSGEYKAQADRLLAISANLNDTFKMLAEGIDGLFLDDGYNFLVNKYDWGFEQQVVWNFVHVLSLREAIIVATNWKSYYDTVRPISVIRSARLYDTITAWGGPGKGTTTFKASEFRQYNSRTDPSPEYPSGACTYYSAYATVASKFLGTDDFGWVQFFAPGSSEIEPDTPKQEVELFFPTWESLKVGAMDGREAGLVHFQFAVEQGTVLGEKVGAELHKTIATLFKTNPFVKAQH